MSEPSSVPFRHYPICLDINGKKCTVVGGGKVAYRRAASLVAAGAQVTVISPSFCDEMATLDAVTRKDKCFEDDDLADSFLAFAATDDRDVNERVAAAAKARGLLVNVADDPPHCSFIVPATLTRGPLTVSISTSGVSPALAGRLRRALEEQLGEEYEQLLNLLSEFRPQVLANLPDPARRHDLLTALAAPEMLDALREHGLDAARASMENLIQQAWSTPAP